MSTPHLPADVPFPPTPTAVLPLCRELGSVAGQLVMLLSLEVWEGWADLRFARIDVGATRPLPRRVPPATAWEISADGRPLTVVDAVGRGDRAFSNGEVRLQPAPALDATLTISVEVVPGAPALRVEVPLPGAAQ